MEEKNYGLTNDGLRNILNYTIRVIVFVCGIFILALGAATLITANVGVATWDVLHIGLARISSLSVGRWVQIVGITMVLMTCVFERKRPVLGSVLNIVLVGFFLNFILSVNIIPHFDNIGARILLLIIGIILMGIGSGMYVASKVGAGPRDGMTLFLARRFSISVRLARTILEISALTIGWLIGGPVSIGTFISVPVMQASLKVWTIILKKLY